MFFIETTSQENLEKASSLINAYNVEYSFMVKGGITTIIVDGGEDDHLCELAFMMNWHQKRALLCGHCDEERTCGHMCFVKPINPAF